MAERDESDDDQKAQSHRLQNSELLGFLLAALLVCGYFALRHEEREQAQHAPPPAPAPARQLALPPNEPSLPPEPASSSVADPASSSVADQVQHVLEPARAPIFRCLKADRGERPGLEGNIVVTLQLSDESLVASVSLSDSPLRSERFDACVKKALESLTFPPEVAGRRLNVPYSFR